MQFLDCGNAVNLSQLAQRHPLKRCISPTVAMVEHLLGIFVSKRANHI
jgi:hypothetical protein